MDVVAKNFPGGKLTKEHFAEAQDLFIEKFLEYPDARDVAYEHFCADKFRKGRLQPPKAFLLVRDLALLALTLSNLALSNLALSALAL